MGDSAAVDTTSAGGVGADSAGAHGSLWRGTWKGVECLQTPSGPVTAGATGSLHVKYDEVLWERDDAVAHLEDVPESLRVGANVIVKVLKKTKKCQLRLPLDADNLGKGRAFVFRLPTPEGLAACAAAIRAAKDTFEEAREISGYGAAAPLASMDLASTVSRGKSVMRGKALGKEAVRPAELDHVTAAEAAERQRAAAEEAQAARRLLDSDGKLRAAYNDLVRSGILSEAEFWESHQASVLEERAVAQRSEAIQSGRGEALLTTFRPGGESGAGSGAGQGDVGADGGASVAGRIIRREMTADKMLRIFLANPAVQDYYEEVVETGKMTQDEFWQLYFESEYFYRAQGKEKPKADERSRGRNRRTIAGDKARAFESALSAADKKQREAVKTVAHVRPDVDLTATSEDNPRSSLKAERSGYGTNLRARQYADADHRSARTDVHERNEGLVTSLNTFGSMAVRSELGGDVSKRTETAELDPVLAATEEEPPRMPLKLQDERKNFAALSIADDAKGGRAQAGGTGGGGDAGSASLSIDDDLRLDLVFSEPESAGKGLRRQLDQASEMRLGATKAYPQVSKLLEDAARDIFTTNNDLLFHFYKNLNGTHRPAIAAFAGCQADAHMLATTLKQRLAPRRWRNSKNWRRS